MTKQELLEMGLTEEQAAKITEDYGKNYVSKSQFNTKNEDAKELRKRVAELERALDDAKNADNPELAALKKKVERLTEDYEQAQAKQKAAEERERTARIQRAAMEALTKGQATNPAEISKIVVQRIVTNDTGEDVFQNDDGTVTDIESGVAAYLQANPWAVADTQQRGNGMTGKLSKTSITHEQFNSMSYKERAELFTTDPDTYNELTKGE